MFKSCGARLVVKRTISRKVLRNCLGYADRAIENRRLSRSNSYVAYSLCPICSLVKKGSHRKVSCHL